jgi:hypothetical protein
MFRNTRSARVVERAFVAVHAPAEGLVFLTEPAIGKSLNGQGVAELARFESIAAANAAVQIDMHKLPRRQTHIVCMTTGAIRPARHIEIGQWVGGRSLHAVETGILPPAKERSIGIIGGETDSQPAWVTQRLQQVNSAADPIGLAKQVLPGRLVRNHEDKFALHLAELADDTLAQVRPARKNAKERLIVGYRFEHFHDVGMRQWIAAALELDETNQRKQGLGYLMEEAYIHVPPVGGLACDAGKIRQAEIGDRKGCRQRRGHPVSAPPQQEAMP